MRIAAKVARIAAKVLVIALAAIALIVGVTWSFLQTRRGGELARRVALPRLNAAIAGQIELDRFAFGGDRLTFDDVAVYDPEGRLAARIARIDITFSPLALLRRHVDVARIDIRRPELTLIEEERGLNLARALAPRHPAPSRAPAGEPENASGRDRLAVDVRALFVSDGAIDYRAPAAKDESRHVKITELSVRASARLAGERLDADARINVHGGRADLRAAYDGARRRGAGNAHASIRGVAVAVDARIDGDALEGHARVDATDLAATARALARDFELPRLAMAGEGRLDVTLGGTTGAPSLRASAHFPQIEFAEMRARSLALTAWVPDLGVPEALNVDANATTLSVGGQRLRAPTVTVRAAGRNISAHVAIAAPQPLRIDLTGTRQRGRTIFIDALSLRYPEATWTLRRRAKLALGDRIVLSGFELGADHQRIVADLELGGGAPRARVVVSRFDLARLPAALVPASLALAGTLDADVDVVLAEPPRVVARAKLAGGRVRGQRNLAFELDGRLERGRAKGELDARALGVDAKARFDLPADWPPRNARTRLDLQVDIADADLGAVAAAVAEAGGGPAAGRLAGHARVSVRLDGRVGNPRLQAAVSGRGLVIDGHRIGDLQLAVNGEGDGKVAAQLSSTAPARTNIQLETPLSLRALLRRPPTAATLARTPLTIKGTVDRLPLAVLARAASYREKVGGALSANLSITGTASDPEGTLAVDVTGATVGRFPPTDARVELDLRGQALEARARVVRREVALLAAEARIGTAPAALLRPTQLAAAPLRVRAVFGPYQVQRLGLPPVTEREPPRELHGKVHADLAVDGTVGAPRALFHLQASDIYLDKALVGYAQIEARYADRQAKLDAQLASHNGGTLHAVAGVTADLGYPAVTTRLDVRRVPFDLRLDAKRFDVQGLSGITQDLRTVAGLLDASLSVRGTAADPRVNGRLEWTDGVVAVTGFGEYKKIHVAVHGDADHVTLDELSTASGSGSARVVGSATHKAGGYDVAASTKLDRFPIYMQGQAAAIVSLDSRLNGRAAMSGARLSVDVDAARVELTDAKRKDLQSLDAPKDVVLMRGGEPLNDE